MHEIDLLFVLLAAMTLLIGIADRLQIPYPILLTLGGLGISLIPGLPLIELDPDVVFLIFLPPILTAAAFFMPLRDFRANLRAIGLLAIGLVTFTTTLVALVARALLPDLSWAAAFTLGAIVSPPDAIAATSIARQLRLPQRLVVIMEGESLVNDASALVFYRIAITAALTGSFSLLDAGREFVVTSVGGVLTGLVLAWLVGQMLKRLNNTPVELVLTFLGSFFAYLIAERLHVSGVLSAVALGLYVGYISPRAMPPATRVQAEAVWNIVVFLLNGLAFILIGLQLPTIVRDVGRADLGQLVIAAAAIALTCIVARLIWVFPGTYLPRYLGKTVRLRNPQAPSWRSVLVLGWAGMRGIVSLAAALSLPREFPNREAILFITFCVILATLVGQGLTLPALIRRLGVRGDDGHEEENRARLVVASAGLARLDELASEEWTRDAHLDDLRHHYIEQRDRFAARFDMHTAEEPFEHTADAFLRLRDELLRAEQQALIELRDTDTINDEVLRTVQRELDLERLRLGLG